MKRQLEDDTVSETSKLRRTSSFCKRRLRNLEDARQSARRGLAFVWLHFIYEPIVYRRRKRAAHELLAGGSISAEIVETAETVSAAFVAPFHAQLPSRPSDFLEEASDPEADKQLSLASVLDVRRAALRAALAARLQSLREEPSSDAGERYWFTKVPLEVNRSYIFDSSVEALLAARPAQLLAGLHVRFYSASECPGDLGEAEAGVDSGGLTREFFELVLREVVAPKGESRLPLEERTRGTHCSSESSVAGIGQPMFREQADLALMIIPSSRHVAAYFALGRLIGAALVQASYGDIALPFRLNDCLLKYMTGKAITIADVRRRDPMYYRHRIEELLKPGGIEAVASALMVDELVFKEGARELKPGGASEVVTLDNVQEYVQLLSEEYVCGAVREEISEFLAGFHDVVPLSLLEKVGLSFNQLGSLLGGAPTLDVDSWQHHAQVNAAGIPASEASSVAQRFWSLLRAWSEEERSAVLAFATGCSRLPAVGFARLEPTFTLEVVPHSGQLPTAHTCFNTLTLPAYGSSAELSKKLHLAIHEGATLFSLV